MNAYKNLDKAQSILKLKELVESITTCFFCTDVKSYNESIASVMTAQEVDEEGSIWFFSGLDSDRNKNIEIDKKVQLYFSNPSNNTYLALRWKNCGLHS
jgi:general stress protein 26